MSFPPSGNSHAQWRDERRDRKSTRLNSSHQIKSYAVFCLKKKNQPMSSSAIICSFVPGSIAQANVEPCRLKGASRFSMKNTGRRITCEGKRRARTQSSIRDLLSKCGTPVRLFADPTEE